jgi:4-carboxymuconolactone decarboxylase
MDERDREVFDRLTLMNDDPGRGKSGPGKGLRGPTGIYLHSPALADAAARQNYYLRFGTQLSPRIREIAILTVAQALQSAFEWNAHEPIARREGISEAVLKAIKSGELDAVDENDRTVIALARESLIDHRVNRETYDRALTLLGPKQLVELAALIGNYASTAYMLNIFAMKTPR